MAFWHPFVFPPKVFPSAWRCFIEPHLMDAHFVLAVVRPGALHDIPSCRNVQLDLKVLEFPSHISRNVTTHDRLIVDIPYHPPGILVPSKAVRMTLWVRNVVDIGVKNTMLVVVFAVILAPMQTGVVCRKAIPRLHDIYLAVCWPGERLFRKHPEGRPDTFRAWGCDAGHQVPSISFQGLVTGKSS